MEKDFHYYITYALAKAARLDSTGADPRLVACASEFVDDNNEGQFMIDGQAVSFPERIPSDGGFYYPIMTQSLSPKSLDPYVQKYVYVPFHFLPGDNSVTLNGKKNPLNTTPGSPNARALLSGALRSRDPFRIGIAAHTFADTWSHQNFTGMRESWNAVHEWYDLFKAMVPNIGHAEAGHAPDMISETWTDFRMPKGQRAVVNRTRALAAAEALYGAFAAASQHPEPWDSVRPDFERILGLADYDDRIASAADFVKLKFNDPIPNYCKDAWIDEALDRDGDTVVMRPGFEQTPWHLFNQAAKIHFSEVMILIRGIL